MTTAEVAKLADVHRDTLLRWLRSGLVSEPSRDRHGWRAFSPQEATAIAQFAQTAQEPPPYLPQSQLQTLQKIDWDFKGAKTSYLTHGLHPYPAKFIPQIPNALIQELSCVGDTVGDIFCGSGTTLVEALTLKRNAVGIDANPLACLISRGKTTPLTDADANALIEMGRELRSQGEEIEQASENTLFKGAAFRSSGWRPEFPKLNFWFPEHCIEELAEARLRCTSLKSPAARELALVSLSSIVVAVSHQDSDTRYVRREKGIGPGETLKRFARSLDQNVRCALELTELLEPRFSCQVREGDLLRQPEIPTMDLLVCSPPYPNAYSYHLYHMTRMVWLGMNQQQFKQEEIGSHRKYSSKSRTAATVETFKSEFEKIMLWAATKLKRGGYACFVVGDSTVRGVRINNADLIKSAGEKAGFREAIRLTRTMQSSKKSFNPAHGRIKSEDILVLENGA